MPQHRSRYLLALPVLIAVTALGTGGSLSPEDQLARDIFEELIEIDTTPSTGNTTVAAQAMARRLLDAGFDERDVTVLGPHPRKGNLVVRFRGSGEHRPLLLLAHLDVVEARREDWSFEPFILLEKDGHFYGRGTSDDKAMAAIWVANFITFKTEGFRPNRDLILALTADEEGGPHNGVSWLLENHRELIDAAFCLNEGGAGRMQNGRRLTNGVQMSEKVYLSFRLEARNPGGHSSLPRRDNAIYELSSALVRLSEFRFPVELDEVTSAFFERMAEVEMAGRTHDLLAVARGSDLRAAARLSRSPYFNALLRTTCVATTLEAGHAENALPQAAHATVNCRLLPGTDPKKVAAMLESVVGNASIRVTALGDAKPSPASPLSDDVLGPIERVTEEMWPGVTVIPTMSTGATDGLYLRRAGIPTYGVSGIFVEVGDARAHGRDERVSVESFFEGREFLYRLTKAMSSTQLSISARKPSSS